MAEYIFEDMTAEQAFGVGPGDLISVRSGSATRTTVIFTENGLYQVTVEGKTLLFPTAFREIADGSFDGVVFPDDSRLHVGDSTANTFALTPNPAVPVSGAAYGGGGDDSFRATGGKWLIQGNQGADRIELSGGQHTIYGGQDSDLIVLNFLQTSGEGSFIQGNKGDDSVNASAGGETILGGQGSDTIAGQSGPDYINGNLGDDRIQGQGVLLGEGGHDTISADGAIHSTIYGGEGNDKLTASPFAGATVDGGDGNDTITASATTFDALTGGAGDDVITTRKNPIDGGDSVDGGEGNDHITAEDSSDDTLNGGAGDDTIVSGGGQDVMSGGEGADRFVLTWFTDPGNNFLGDRILDWSSEDRIQLDGPAAGRYAEGTAADIDTATDVVRQLASQLPAAGGASSRGAVAMQIGADVHVYSLYPDGLQGVVTILVGRTLADISGDNFI